MDHGQGQHSHITEAFIHFNIYSLAMKSVFLSDVCVCVSITNQSNKFKLSTLPGGCKYQLCVHVKF